MLNINSFNNIQIYNFAINKTTKKTGARNYVYTYVCVWEKNDWLWCRVLWHPRVNQSLNQRINDDNKFSRTIFRTTHN